jgi:biopolymer transport protein ExbB
MRLLREAIEMLQFRNARVALGCLLQRAKQQLLGNTLLARNLSACAVLAGSMVWSATSAHAASLDEVESQLVADIQTAQRALGETEAAISRERGALAQQLNEAQNRVLDLRQRTVAARRAADEETLSLQQIETRLQSWQEQSDFQSRLLAGFLGRNGLRPASATAINMQDDLAVFADYLAAQETRLYPRWQDEALVLPDGQLAEASQLALGPVRWFTHAGTAGLVSTENGRHAASLMLEGEAAAGILALQTEGTGVITFDPTLSRALLLVEDEETLLQHLQKGGIWVIPILLFALFATVTAGLKGLWLYRLPALLPALAERVERAAKEGHAAVQALQQQTTGAQALLLNIALLPQTNAQRDDRLHAALLQQRNHLEHWLGAIAITAAVSPLLGLLGTVSGMIATFKLMTLFGAGDASAVSAGISEALVTTELGLVVAIPALLAHALMSRRVKSYFAALENDAVQLSQLPLQQARA